MLHKPFETSGHVYMSFKPHETFKFEQKYFSTEIFALYNARFLEIE